MKCYLDGSQGQDETKAEWLTLAGYSAVDSFWSDFDTKWRRMREERKPIAAYIHMIDLLSRKDPFEWGVYGWNKEKIDQLIIDAVDVLQQMDKSTSSSFICTVDLAAHAKLVKEGCDIPTPSAVCVRVVVPMALAWNAKINPTNPEPVHLLFDRGEKFMSAFKREWLDKRTTPGNVPASITVWNMIANIEEVDQAFAPPVQAADMLAWSRTRGISPEFRDWRHLADVIQKVIPNDTIDLTESTMRELYC
jgi:hypothetical protein